MNSNIDFNNPKTFNEKLQWLKLYDRNPLYTKLSDKYEVRKYIADNIGEEHLIPLLGVWNNFDEINFEELPNQFVLKCTHDSGGVIICKDKSTLDINKAKLKINKCLKRNYYNLFREWPYKNIKPKIICEKYMVDESGIELKDYKIFCFNGEPKLIQVDYSRFTAHIRNLYDTQWNFMPFSILYLNDEKTIIKRPERLEDMLNYSKILAKDYPHLRVDMYSIKNQIYFGELTFFPGAGYVKFTPESYDYALGNLLELPNMNESKEGI